MFSTFNFPSSKSSFAKMSAFSYRRAKRWVATLVGLTAVGFAHGEAPAPGPMASAFPIATVTALLRPSATQRIVALQSGKFYLTVESGGVSAGDAMGHFDDTELRAARESADLRLRAARQSEIDFLADAPTRRQEALARINDLEGRVTMAEALAKNPNLLRDLPPSIQAALSHTDAAGLKSRLDAARAQAARLDLPAQNDASAAHLQVLEAERILRETDARLRDAIVTAPFSGVFQSATTVDTGSGRWVGAGQEIGVVRDLTRVIAAVPALSPYLVRSELGKTELRARGRGGRIFSARFKDAVTEPSAVLGETRIFLYEFSESDSRDLTTMVQTNVDAQVFLLTDQPVAVVPKLEAALKYPDAFRDGWAAGAEKAWPGWRLVCEGENSLGLLPQGTAPKSE
jgi:hypothetical protein